MNWIEVESRYGKRLVDADHIVFVRPPREGSEWYTLVFDHFDYDSEDRIEYFHMMCNSPSYDELVKKLNKCADKTETILDRIYKVLLRRVK